MSFFYLFSPLFQYIYITLYIYVIKVFFTCKTSRTILAIEHKGEFMCKTYKADFTCKTWKTVFTCKKEVVSPVKISSFFEKVIKYREGTKKNPKVNGHISTANKRIPEILFLQPPQYYQVFLNIFFTRACTHKRKYSNIFTRGGFQKWSKMYPWPRKSKYNHDNHWATFPDLVNRLYIRNTFLLKKNFWKTDF